MLEPALSSVGSPVGEVWDQWDNFDIFAFGKLADTFKVR